MSLRILGTVVRAEPDPQARDSLRPYLVSVRVDELLEGGPLAAEEIYLLVHSPTRTFADPDPVGERYLLTFAEPLTDPYSGSLDVQPPPPSNSACTDKPQ